MDSQSLQNSCCRIQLAFLAKLKFFNLSTYLTIYTVVLWCSSMCRPESLGIVVGIVFLVLAISFQYFNFTADSNVSVCYSSTKKGLALHVQVLNYGVCSQRLSCCGKTQLAFTSSELLKYYNYTNHQFQFTVDLFLVTRMTQTSITGGLIFCLFIHLDIVDLFSSIKPVFFSFFHQRKFYLNLWQFSFKTFRLPLPVDKQGFHMFLFAVAC